MFKLPKNDKKYSWTHHVTRKMMFYRISPSMIKRIIRHPHRVEEGIVPNTVAAMKKPKTKKTQEIWVMYQLTHKSEGEYNSADEEGEKIRVITAWRYPGKSPKRDPVPDEILNEIKSIL